MSHCRLYVLVPRSDVESSKEAREFVDRYLMDNNFCCEGGRWGGGVGDWYVIGGRFSGELSMIPFSQERQDAYFKELDEKKLIYYETGDKKRERDEKIFEVFFRHFPEMRVLPGVQSMFLPLEVRDSYEHYGFEDDAMVVTDAIWERVIEPNLKTTAYHDGSAVIRTDEFDDPGTLGVDKEQVVDHFWIVLVDFHF